MRIAVIHHETCRPARIGSYLVADFCCAWESSGHEVVHLHGSSRFVPADVALIHVDLSVVPPRYFELGRRYPVALNLRINDIRKRRVSQAALRPGDSYDGPVIVKTDLNHGGFPERAARPLLQSCAHRVRALLHRGRPAVGSSYPVFQSLADVPAILRRDRRLVIERFLPEREGSSYFVRQTFFLGDRSVSWRLRGEVPVLRASIDDVEIPTPPSISAFRREAGLDYGKIDYVEHQGREVVIDVNKTIGGRGTAPATVERLAAGIAARSRGTSH
jgi:hypothetical protein